MTLYYASTLGYIQNAASMIVFFFTSNLSDACMEMHVTEDFISMAHRCMLTYVPLTQYLALLRVYRTSTIYCVTITSDVIWQFSNKIWKQCWAYSTTSSTYDTGHTLSKQ